MSTVGNTNQRWTVYVIDCDQRLGVPYFGMTSQPLNGRFAKHQFELKTRLHPNKKLQHLYDQYGKDSLNIREVATFDNEQQASVLESTLIRTWIDHTIVGWEVCNTPANSRAGRSKQIFKWRGNTYEGLRQLSDATGLSTATLSLRIRNNKTVLNDTVFVLPPEQVVRAASTTTQPTLPYKAGRKTTVKVEWNGKIYSSVKELALAAGTTTGTISNAIKRNIKMFGHPIRKVV